MGEGEGGFGYSVPRVFPFYTPVLEVSTRSVGFGARQVTIERMQAAAATPFPTNPLPLWHVPAEGAQPWRGADEDSPWNRRDLEGDFGSGSELSSGDFTVPPALPPLLPPSPPTPLHQSPPWPPPLPSMRVPPAPLTPPETAKGGFAPPPPPQPGTLYTAFGHTRPVEEAVVPLSERGFEKLYDDTADVRGELRRLNHSLIISVIETLDAATKRSSQHSQKASRGAALLTTLSLSPLVADMDACITHR